MSRQLRLSARQRVAGELLEVGITLLISGPADDTIQTVAIGTTTTRTRPSGLASFAHVEQNNIVDAGIWSVRRTYNSFFPQGGEDWTKYTVVMSYSTTRVLDANYARGKYLWAFAANDGPITTDSVIQLLSGPYLIR